MIFTSGPTRNSRSQKLAKIYKNVVATDVSSEQLEFAPKSPNVRYHCTPPKMSIEDIEKNIAAESSVDLVASAEAMHWFDLPSFFQHVRWVLKKPNGVIAAWCYTFPEINCKVDALLQQLYSSMAEQYFKPESKLVLQHRYKAIDFPFEPVDGLDHNGPFEFKMEKSMDLDGYFGFIRSWSSYKAAKGKGIEFLTDSVVKEFTQAWNEDGKPQKIATYPISLRIGKVGN